jgi:acetyl-CoA acetyltransferase
MRGRVVIAGAGETAWGKHPGRHRIDLIVEAARAALAEAGVEKGSIGGLFVKMANSEPSFLYGQAVAESMGMKPLMGASLDQGGAAPIALISYAAMAIEAGMINAALVCYGDTPRTGSRSVYERPRGDGAAYGMYSSASGYAFIHQAYRQRYRVPDEAFGRLVVQTRVNGAANPAAQLRLPLTLEDYLNRSRTIEPMRRDDMCLLSDGAAAVLLLSRERAKVMGCTQAVPVLGFGQGQESWDIHLRADLTTSRAKESAAMAFRMAGMGPKDINVAQLYDCFSIVPLITMEDYGFAKPGQAGAMVAEGQTAPDGRLALNTAGGLLSYSGSPGLPLVIEAVRQMQGGAVTQVRSPRAAIVSNQGGAMQTHATLILGTPQ